MEGGVLRTAVENNTRTRGHWQRDMSQWGKTPQMSLGLSNVGFLQTPAHVAWRRNSHRNNDLYKLPFTVAPLPSSALPACSTDLNLLNLQRAPEIHKTKTKNPIKIRAKNIKHGLVHLYSSIYHVPGSMLSTSHVYSHVSLTTTLEADATITLFSRGSGR